MRLLAAASLLVLASCNPRPNPQAEHLARENDPTIVNAQGSYQIIPGPNGGFYLLDTRHGKVRLCEPRGIPLSLPADGTVPDAKEIFCGKESDTP